MVTTQKSRGHKNCNPLNVKISNNNWFGKIAGSDTTFETFTSCYYGYRAAFICLRHHYFNGHKTISSLINKWAPCSENQTNRYVDYVSKSMRVNQDIEINWNAETVYRLMFFMCIFENGYFFEDHALAEVIQRYINIQNNA